MYNNSFVFNNEMVVLVVLCNKWASNVYSYKKLEQLFVIFEKKKCRELFWLRKEL